MDVKYGLGSQACTDNLDTNLTLVLLPFGMCLLRLFARQHARWCTYASVNEATMTSLVTAV